MKREEWLALINRRNTPINLHNTISNNEETARMTSAEWFGVRRETGIAWNREDHDSKTAKG